MIRTSSILLCAALLASTACNKRAPENKEAIRAAVTEHVTKNAGIDVAQIALEVGDVKFEGNQATATVSFKPKNAPDQGMTLSYTLERKGEAWTVKGRGAGHGSTMGGGMGGAMPGAGAMPGGGAMPGKDGEMPAGHPPTNQPGAAKDGELPSGHPPVNEAPKK